MERLGLQNILSIRGNILIKRKRFYEKFARKKFVPRQMHKKLQYLLVEIGINKLVLDAGCGDGLLTQKIKERGNEVIGVDISSYAKELAEKRNVRVVLHDLEVTPWPFGTDNFDVIVGSEILEHIINLNDFLRECYRILKKRGFLLLTVPNVVYWKARVKFLFGKFSDQSHKGHYHYFTQKTLADLLTKNGFQVVKFIGIGGFTITRTIYKLFPSLTGDLLVKSVKIEGNRIP